MNHFQPLPVNHSVFKVIDTPQKAYLLGFLLADGYIRTPKPDRPCNRVNLRIKAVDIKVCQMLLALAGGNLRLIENGYRAEWEVFSASIAADLISLGVTPRKTTSAALNWELIPEHLHGAVLAGLIDGDGHLRHSRRERRAELVIVTASAALRNQLLERFWFLHAKEVLPRHAHHHVLYRIQMGTHRKKWNAMIETVYAGLPFSILARKQAVLDQLKNHLDEMDAYDAGMARVPEMKASGMTIKEIAQELGTSLRPVRARLEARNIDSRKVVFTEKDHTEMRRLHESGLTVLQIHAALGISSEEAVRYHLVRMGLISRKPAVPQRHPHTDEVLNLYQELWTVARIAKHLGICPKVTGKSLRDAGIVLQQGSPKKLDDAGIHWAAAQLAERKTLRSVAEHLGVSGTLVRLRVRALQRAEDGGREEVSGASEVLG